jgi:hypothetical protein
MESQKTAWNFVKTWFQHFTFSIFFSLVFILLLVFGCLYINFKDIWNLIYFVFALYMLSIAIIWPYQKSELNAQINSANQELVWHQQQIRRTKHSRRDIRNRFIGKRTDGLITKTEFKRFDELFGKQREKIEFHEKELQACYERVWVVTTIQKYLGKTDPPRENETQKVTTT